jgi:hypothetical protein
MTRDKHLHIMLSAEEFERLQQLAKDHGLSTSSFVRLTLLTVWDAYQERRLQGGDSKGEA